MTPWVGRLIAVNAAAFFLGTVMPRAPLLLALQPAFILQRPWTVLTYMFLHANLMHLAFNMLGLYFFGPRLEERLGSAGFLRLYFLSGFTGAVLSLLQPFAVIVGASGAVFGVLIGFARYWPRERIYIWGVLPIEARVLVIVMTALSLMGGLGVGQGGVAHFAHLGGFLGGWLYLKWTEWRSPAAQFRAKATPGLRPTAAGDLQRWRQISRERLHPVNRDEFDRIQHKIATAGAASLTPDERAFLNRFSSPGAP